MIMISKVAPVAPAAGADHLPKREVKQDDDEVGFERILQKEIEKLKEGEKCS